MAMVSPTTFPSRLWTMVMLLGMNQDMLMKTLFSYTPLSSICPSGGPYAGSAPPGEGPSLTTITQNSQNTLSYIYIPNHNPTLLQFPQSYGYGYDFQYSSKTYLLDYVKLGHGWVMVMTFKMVMVMDGYGLWL